VYAECSNLKVKLISQKINIIETSNGEIVESKSKFFITIAFKNELKYRVQESENTRLKYNSVLNESL
jgi:hypothetical protein